MRKSVMVISAVALVAVALLSMAQAQPAAAERQIPQLQPKLADVQGLRHHTHMIRVGQQAFILFTTANRAAMERIELSDDELAKLPDMAILPTVASQQTMVVHEAVPVAARREAILRAQ